MKALSAHATKRLPPRSRHSTEGTCDRFSRERLRYHSPRSQSAGKAICCAARIGRLRCSAFPKAGIRFVGVAIEALAWRVGDDPHQLLPRSPTGQTGDAAAGRAAVERIDSLRKSPAVC